jgi:class 3 adenylate cyclase
MNKGRVAVITSCFEGTLAENAQKLAEIGINSLDIYWPDMLDTSIFSRNSKMARHVDGQWELTDADAIFGWLNQQICQAEDEARTRLRIVSMTTSYPSISEMSRSAVGSQAGALPDSQGMAVNSIVTLLKVAERLRLPCIQVRAGRRIFKEKGTLKYNRDDPALQRLLQSLIEIYRQYHSDGKGKLKPGKPKVALALELEPGESFLLRSLEHINRLSDKIQRSVHDGELPRDWVGLNLDIGHCLILKDGERVLPTEFPVENRLILPIYGAHISDHSIHHAADLAPGFFNKVTTFDDYLKFYLKQVPGYYPQGSAMADYYSGHISLELEAVGYLHHVARAHRTVNWRLFDLDLHPRQRDPEPTKACVIFADLRDSTEATCEFDNSKEWAELIEFTNKLNEIFLKRVREIEPHARLDKFIGDAVMIVLQGPMREMAQAALDIAVEIQSEINKQFRHLHPSFQGVGIGIGGGDMVAGFIGPRAFEEETVLGREVIFASRLSGEAKSTQTLVSPSFLMNYYGIEDLKKIPKAQRRLWRHVPAKKSKIRLGSKSTTDYWEYLGAKVEKKTKKRKAVSAAARSTGESSKKSTG